MGTPDFAVEALRRLVEAGTRIVQLGYQLPFAHRVAFFHMDAFYLSGGLES